MRFSQTHHRNIALKALVKHLVQLAEARIDSGHQCTAAA